MPEAQVVPASHPGAKEAILHYCVLCASELGTWLEIELETGRTHQIRVQAASRGHAVLGDAQYGSRLPFGPDRADVRERAIALHARGLAFTDPVANMSVELVANPPAMWDALRLPLDLF
jgi:23S rRNA pseudouridine1911/1915/1917 synthase